MSTITVDQNGGAGIGETGTTLREAIGLTDATAGEDVILFDTGVFTGGTQSLIRLGSTLIVDESVTIDATSVGGVTITGDTLANDILRPGTLITDVEATDAVDLEDNVRVVAISTSEANEHPQLIGQTITGGRTTGENGGTFLDPARGFHDAGRRHPCKR